MGFLLRISELLLKGALASFLLLYALDFKTASQKWKKDIVSNLDLYAFHLGFNDINIQAIVADWLPVYSQWLVIVSLMILATNFKTGKVLYWLTLIINLLLCWNQTEWLFLGIFNNMKVFI